VFFTSDHGDYGGHRGLISKIPWIPFDDLAKVPFFCSGQGIREGQRLKPPVQSFDLALTTLELAKIPVVPIIFDGQSLTVELTGRELRPLRLVFSATTQGYPMLRCGRFKYVEHHWRNEWVLFDLEDDPSETKDVAKAYPDTVNTFRDLLKKKMSQGIPGLAIPPPAP
jgi:choline-sulfatase